MDTVSKELIFKDDEQDYAVVIDMLGHGRCRVKCLSDDREYLGIIRGNMRKKSLYFIRRNDVVLASFRDYQHDKVDICHLYTDEEVSQLKDYGEIQTEENDIEFKNDTTNINSI